MGFSAEHAIFCTAWGQTVTPGHVRRVLKGASQSAGIVKRVHPHGLRHTLAAELREEGIDIGAISKQLGHTDISTTARYLDHIAPWKVVEVIASRVHLVRGLPGRG
ncbi:MAG: tyrosine-type recombinase/integrase [Phycisphaerales bacterium]|nr:tyrosine-type recombinase/integrase [Phycisphaerales bacterium]